MGPLLHAVHFALPLSARTPPAVPVPEAKCYVLPYGSASFIGGFVTSYMVICLLNYRRPLYPWRQIQRQQLSLRICQWSLAVMLILQGVNLFMCAGKNSALEVITVGRAFLLFIFYMLPIQAITDKGMNVSEKKTSPAGRQENGHSNNEQDGNAVIGAEATDTEAVTEITESEVVSQASGPSKSDLVEPLYQSSPQERPPDRTDPPPPYESAFHESSPIFSLAAGRSEHEPLSATTTPFETYRKTLSSSCNAGTQTDPPLPLSPTDAAQHLSTIPTTADTRLVVPKGAVIPILVVLFVLTGLTSFVLAGSYVLAAAIRRAGRKDADRLVGAFTFIISLFSGPVVLVTIFWLFQAVRERWRRRAGRVQYTELVRVEDSQVPRAPDMEGNQDGSASGRPDINDSGAAAIRFSRDGTSVDEEEGQSSFRRSEEAERAIPNTIPSTSTSGMASQASSKLASRFVILAAFVVIANAWVSTWFADFVIASATGNVDGFPDGTSIKATVFWVAFMISSKLPLLCI